MATLTFNAISSYSGLAETTIAVVTAINYLALQYLKNSKIQKEEGQLKHIAADLALTPIRLVLIYLSFPLVAQYFRPGSEWTADDASRSLAGWMLLSLGYMFEMWHTETNLMGILHHSIAYGYTAFSLTCMSDESVLHANVARYMALELFFAIGIGGIITSVLRILYLSVSPANMASWKCYSISFLTWSLTAVITCGWSIKVHYIHSYSQEFFDYFGAYICPLVLAAIGLIYSIQYHWIFLWAAKVDRLFQKCGKLFNINVILRKTPLRAVFALLTLGLADSGRLYVQILRAI